MQIQRPAMMNGKIILTLGAAALLLAGCSKTAPKTAYIPSAPPALVGHVYAVAIDVPPPVSPRIKFTPSQQEQVQQAFNVVGLKSALMVAALSCGQQDKYDAFMNSFQPHVLAAQHVMDAYFRKASGSYSGQKMEDSFVTQLANNQSDTGMAQGASFCPNNAAEFNAVLALKTPQDLDGFATDEPPAALTTVASATPTR